MIWDQCGLSDAVYKLVYERYQCDWYKLFQEVHLIETGETLHWMDTARVFARCNPDHPNTLMIKEILEEEDRHK